MKKIFILLLLPWLLDAGSYEDKFYRDKTHHPSAVAIHADLGYSSYMIELHSSEIDSAIDYNILELTLGASSSYAHWMWGIYGKFVVDEISSNMNIATTGQRLNDNANIDKDEFGLYSNYTITQSETDAWRVNMVYRYASLNAKDSYLSYHYYNSLFRYTTKGLALSLVYSQLLTKNSLWFTNIGIVYSEAKVESFESVDRTPQDSFVDDSSDAMGSKFSFGYSYKLRDNLFFNLRTDWWQSSFGELVVSSRVGDNLPKAKLKENSYTCYSGFSWSF